jgi:hypothetical protein
MIKTILAIVGILALIVVGVLLLIRWFMSGPTPGPF